MNTSTLVQTAQIMGITGASCLAGAIGSVSYMAMPALATAPVEVRVRQWHKVYRTGQATAPPLALTSALCFGYLAYASPSHPLQKLLFGVASPRLLYGVSAALVPTIVVWTLGIMDPLANNRLRELAAKAEKREDVNQNDAEVGELFRKWTVLNYVRFGLVSTGAILAAVATIAS